MYSFSILEYIENFEKIIYGDAREKQKAYIKMSLYHSVLYVAILRSLHVLICILTNMSLDIIKIYSPFYIFLFIDFFDGSVHLMVCILSLLIFAILLDYFCFFKFSHSAKIIFNDFRKIKTILFRNKINFCPWSRNLNLHKKFDNFKLETGPFLNADMRKKTVFLVLKTNYYVYHFLRSYCMYS